MQANISPLKPPNAADLFPQLRAPLYGIGLDICRIDRIQAAYSRHGLRFAQRILTAPELAVFAQRREANAERGVAYLASRFAAKEALSKALGTGIRGRFGWQSCAVANDALGKPYWEYAADFAAWLAAEHLQAHLSISDEVDLVAAFCVVEQLKPNSAAS